MDEAGWRPAGRRAAGRQCTLAIHSHCGRHTVCLRPSGPQRQSRLSVGRLSTAPGSPTSGPLGVAVLGAQGWTGGQLSLLQTAFPGPFRCGDSRTLFHPEGVSTAGSDGGRAGSGFLGVRSAASDPRKPAAAPSQHPEMEQCLKGKSQQKGCACHKMEPQIILVSQGPPTSRSAWQASRDGW